MTMLTDERSPTDAETEAVGFFGLTRGGRYSATLLRSDLKRRKYERTVDFNLRKCFTLEGDSASLLADELDALGWDAGDSEAIRELCESAGWGKP